MSWLYLPELAAARWGQNTDLDSVPSAMSSANPTLSKSSRRASKTGTLTTPPSGTMPAASRSATINAAVSFGSSAKFAVAWWLQQVSLANLSVWLVSAPEPTTNATAGLTPFALFEKSVPPSSSLKTSLVYSAQWITPQKSLFLILERYSQTWPRAGMLFDGACYRQRKWERRIKEIGSGLLLTPTSQEWGSNTNLRKNGMTVMNRVKMWKTPGATDGEGGVMKMHKDKAGHYKLRDQVQEVNREFWPTPTTPRPHDDEKTTGKYMPSQKQKDLTWAVHFFPTPQAFDAKSSDTFVPGSTHDRQKKEHTLPQFVRAFPSPSARDWRSGRGREENGHTPQLPEVVGGQLNPDWVEWLMGWPIGWTDLKPLETDKFRQWRRSLFGY